MNLLDINSAILKKILGTLVDDLKMTEEELLRTYEYLFGKRLVMPMFKDKELFEAVEYLKEIIGENNISGVDGLVHYYDKMKKQFRDSLDEIYEELQQNSAGTCMYYNGEGDFVLNYEQPTPFHPDGYIPGQALDVFLWENSFDQYIDLMGEALMDDIIMSVKTVIAERKITESHCSYMQGSFSRATALTLSSTAGTYFSHFSKNHGENDWTLIGEHPSENTLVVSKDTIQQLLFNADVGDIRSAYKEVLSLIGHEKPISGRSFKETLTNWLYYSKMVSIALDTSCVEHSHNNSLIDVKQMLIIAGDNFRNKLSSKKWVILKSPADCGWLTSDNPGFSVNLGDLGKGIDKAAVDPSLSQIRDDSVIYYPLSSDYCLRVQPVTSETDSNVRAVNIPVEFENCSQKELFIVNGLTVSTRKKVVVAKEAKVLEPFETLCS